MKKGKKFVIGVVLIVIGVIGLFGVFTETEDPASLALGSIMFGSVGVVFVLLDKRSSKAASKIGNNSYTFKVAGVTFSNEKSDRQTILSRIFWENEPFREVVYSLKKYDYEGAPAIGVYANGEQIGNVPKTDLPFVLDHINNISNIAVKVYGGGKTESGEKLNFGASVTITY